MPCVSSGGMETASDQKIKLALNFQVENSTTLYRGRIDVNRGQIRILAAIFGARSQFLGGERNAGSKTEAFFI